MKYNNDTILFSDLFDAVRGGLIEKVEHHQIMKLQGDGRVIYAIGHRDGGLSTVLNIEDVTISVEYNGGFFYDYTPEYYAEVI